MLSYKNAIFINKKKKKKKKKKILQFWQVHINFCKIACTLSEELDQPAHPAAWSVCAIFDKEAVYLIERVVKTDQTVQMRRLIWIFIKHTD